MHVHGCVLHPLPLDSESQPVPAMARVIPEVCGLIGNRCELKTDVPSTCTPYQRVQLLKDMALLLLCLLGVLLKGEFSAGQLQPESSAFTLFEFRECIITEKRASFAC